MFKDFKENICTRWLGPYEVDTIFDNGTIKLIEFDELQTSLLATVHHLQLYHKTYFKDSSFHTISDSNLQTVGGRGESSYVTNHLIHFSFIHLKKNR